MVSWILSFVIRIPWEVLSSMPEKLISDEENPPKSQRWISLLPLKKMNKPLPCEYLKDSNVYPNSVTSSDSRSFFQLFLMYSTTLSSDSIILLHWYTLWRPITTTLGKSLMLLILFKNLLGQLQKSTFQVIIIIDNGVDMLYWFLCCLIYL